jgi:hypothetical protein
MQGEQFCSPDFDSTSCISLPDNKSKWKIKVRIPVPTGLGPLEIFKGEGSGQENQQKNLQARGSAAKKLYNHLFFCLTRMWVVR